MPLGTRSKANAAPVGGNAAPARPGWLAPTVALGLPARQLALPDVRRADHMVGRDDAGPWVRGRTHFSGLESVARHAFQLRCRFALLVLVNRGWNYPFYDQSVRLITADDR